MIDLSQSASRLILAKMAEDSWIVEWDADAVGDFEDVKSRAERKAVFNGAHKLKALGKDLPAPRVKALKGEPDLLELRPRQGDSPVRPIFARDGNRFIILAVAPNKRSFGRAISNARDRLARYKPPARR